MGSLCRQQAAYNPAQSWKLLAEAEYWEHLAEAELSSHFEECNPTESKALELRLAANSNGAKEGLEQKRPRTITLSLRGTGS